MATSHSGYLQVFECLGSGNFGEVRYGLWKKLPCAVKIFFVCQTADAQTQIEAEIAILRELRHRHIIQFQRTTVVNDRLAFVMDYAENGSLSNAITAKRLEDWPMKDRIAQGIVRGLTFIHGEGVIHRDLKSSNVLLDQYWVVKLCDFGLSVRGPTRGTRVGTACWMAPEIFSETSEYTTKSDVYALGCILWEIASDCTPPFKNEPNYTAISGRVLRGEREPIPDGTPEYFRDLITACWHQDPSERPEAENIITIDAVLRVRRADDSLSLGEPTTVCSDSRLESGVDVMTISSSKAIAQAHVTTLDDLTAIRDCEELAVLDVLSLAENSDKNAQFDLGMMYQQSQGSVHSDFEALYWFHRAASQDHPAAQFLIGEMYKCGKRLPADPVRAQKWYKRAVTQRAAEEATKITGGHMLIVQPQKESQADNNATTQQALAKMLVASLETAKDDFERLVCFRQAADQGLIEAQVRMCKLFENGATISMDIGRAVYWLEKASKHHRQAKLSLEDLARRIIPPSDHPDQRDDSHDDSSVDSSDDSSAPKTSSHNRGEEENIEMKRSFKNQGVSSIPTASNIDSSSSPTTRELTVPDTFSHTLQDTIASSTPVMKKQSLSLITIASAAQFIHQVWPDDCPDKIHNASMTIRVYKRLERLQPNLCAFFKTIGLLIHSCKAAAYTPDVDNPQLFQVLKRLLVHAHLLSTPGYAQNLEVDAVANELLQIQEQLSQLLPNLTDSAADEAGVNAPGAVPGAIERDKEESHTAKKKVDRNRVRIERLFGHHKIRLGGRTIFELRPEQLHWDKESIPIAEEDIYTIFEGEIIEGRHAGERVHIKEFTEIERGRVEDVLLRTICLTHFLHACENIARPKYVVPSLKVVVMDPIMHLTLDKFLQPGVLTLAQKIDVALKVAGALALVHTANIVHRNIQPANIIMTAGRFEDGRMECVPKLTGFELCHHMHAGLDFSLGPKNWAVRDAPEKEKHGSTFQTDVYAFGIMLYEIALGELPKAAHGAEYWSVELAALVHHDYANLMRECVVPFDPDRPEMKVVAKRLAQIASELSSQ